MKARQRKAYISSYQLCAESTKEVKLIEKETRLAGAGVEGNRERRVTGFWPFAMRQRSQDLMVTRVDSTILYDWNLLRKYNFNVNIWDEKKWWDCGQRRFEECKSLENNQNTGRIWVSKAMKLVGSSQDLQQILGNRKYLVSWWDE